ncbi:MAG: response regulator [Rhodospirillales bacterium]
MIYLIDDSPMDALVIQNGLEMAGLEMAYFESAKEFFAKADLSGPANHLLLVDLVMPDTDGLEMLQEMAGEKIGHPIVIITAYEESYIKVALELATTWGLNMVGGLKKPVDIEKVAAIARQNGVN